MNSTSSCKYKVSKRRERERVEREREESSNIFEVWDEDIRLEGVGRDVGREGGRDVRREGVREGGMYLPLGTVTS